MTPVTPRLEDHASLCRCGETGDVVAKGSATTATWVQTTDGLLVSMLYVRVPDLSRSPAATGPRSTGRYLPWPTPATQAATTPGHEPW